MTEQEISAIRNTNDPYHRAEYLDDVIAAWWELNYENQELKQRLQNVINATQQNVANDGLQLR